MFATPTQPSENSLKAFRCALLDFIEDPFYVPESESVRYIPDGLLVVEGGKVKELGTYEHLQDKWLCRKNRWMVW